MIIIFLYYQYMWYEDTTLQIGCKVTKKYQHDKSQNI